MDIYQHADGGHYLAVELCTLVQGQGRSQAAITYRPVNYDEKTGTWSLKDTTSLFVTTTDRWQDRFTKVERR